MGPATYGDLMPDKRLNWEQVRDVLIKRRKAGQAPHWCMGWVAARVARNENEIVNAAYLPEPADPMQWASGPPSLAAPLDDDVAGLAGGLDRGSVLQLFGPRVLWRSLGALFKGNFLGRPSGHETQMPRWRSCPPWRLPM